MLPASRSCNKHELQKLRALFREARLGLRQSYAGLQALDPTTVEIVAVHDGSRPFVTPEEIAQTVEAAELRWRCDPGSAAR